MPTKLEQISMAAFNQASWKPRTFCQTNPPNLGHPNLLIVLGCLWAAEKYAPLECKKGPKIAPKLCSRCDFHFPGVSFRDANNSCFPCFSPGYARLNRASVVVSVMVQADGKILRQVPWSVEILKFEVVLNQKCLGRRFLMIQVDLH